MDEKDKLKPLPKPVSAAPPRREKAQSRPAQHTPPAPVNPDDFEIPDRQRRPAHPPSPPSFGEALGIFFKRLRKKMAKRVSERRAKPAEAPRIPRSQLSPSRESKRAAAARKKRRQMFARLAGVAAAIVFVIVSVVLLVVWMAGKNAFEVTLGEERIGYIALSEDISAARLQTQFVTKLEEAIGAKVQVDQQVTLKEVNTGSGNITAYEAMVDLLSRNTKLTYKISAVALIVQGQEVAVLKSMAEVEKVKEQLAAPYITDNTKDWEFLESWVEETRLVSESELGTVEDALVQLDKKERTMEDYIVKSGDTLDGIARANNTTPDKLCADTPNLTLTTVLQIGQVIKLETTKPYLSVRTIDEVKRKEAIPMETETQKNHSQAKSYLRTIQEGRDGEREITVRSTRVNGRLEQPEEVVNTEITIQPVTRIVEQGTQESNPR